MKKILSLLLLIISISGFPQSLLRTGQDPCSVCKLNAYDVEDSIYYINKIDTIDFKIKHAKDNLSKLYNLKGDYQICLSQYNGKDNQQLIDSAKNNLLKAIKLDSRNWHVYLSLINIYAHHFPLSDERVDSVYKYSNLLLKINDTIGIAYLYRAISLFYLKDLKNSFNDLKKAKKYYICEISFMITVYESFYYLIEQDFKEFYKKIDNIYDDYSNGVANNMGDYFILFHSATYIFDNYPYLKDSIINYIRQHSENIHLRSYLKHIIMKYYEYNNLDLKEIDNL